LVKENIVDQTMANKDEATADVDSSKITANKGDIWNLRVANNLAFLKQPTLQELLHCNILQAQFLPLENVSFETMENCTKAIIGTKDRTISVFSE
jgi:hypothetical protein